MDYELEIRHLAAIEVIEAYDWYESQSEGLGFQFLEELRSFYESLLDNPFGHSYYQEPVRHGKINRFPYFVVYEIVGSAIVVYSVFMSKRHPSKKRIT